MTRRPNPFKGTRRQRLRLVLVMVASLLFQQLAVAGYVCTLPSGGSADVAAQTDNCEAMEEMAAGDTPVPAPPLCVAHCEPDLATTADVIKLGVPALALPAQLYSLLPKLVTGSVFVASAVAPSHADPPPRLRYCSLQI